MCLWLANRKVSMQERWQRLEISNGVMAVFFDVLLWLREKG